MTKQQELREGVKNIIDFRGVLDTSDSLTDAILKFEDEMGAVLQVDRECASDFICDDYMNGLGFLVEDGRTPTELELDRFIKALGYVAVEPLIGEGTKKEGETVSLP